MFAICRKALSLTKYNIHTNKLSVKRTVDVQILFFFQGGPSKCERFDKVVSCQMLYGYRIQFGLMPCYNIEVTFATTL